MSKLSSNSRTDFLLAITPGDPAGIGPDIILQHIQQHPSDHLVIIASKKLLEERARRLDINIDALQIHDVPLANLPQPGHPSSDYANYVLDTLKVAAQGCLDKHFAAMVTGPVNKAVISQSGIHFTGHTEWLAEFTGTQHPVMLLASDSMKVIPVTTHLPLSEVPKAITEQRLLHCLQVAHQELQQRFGIKRPKILVCGLNPHAGDNGLLGHEEQEIIIPALEKCRQQGLLVTGPVAADTAFSVNLRDQFDAIVVMYHDQGLPVIKSHAFGDTVNVTLGLPIIRTSVDHGTAYDLAGTHCASDSSIRAAIRMAETLAEKTSA